MASDYNQRKVFDFLSEWLEKRGTFAVGDLKSKTDWTDKTWQTYYTKQLKVFLAEVSPGRYRVAEVFRAYAQWPKFRNYVSQNRAAEVVYSYAPPKNVLIFDFYMPLTNEEYLKATLDSLFYKDTILRKLEWKERAELEKHFPPLENENDNSFYDRICGWIDERFIGYSISHVSGRFRAMNLTSRSEALAATTSGKRYLVDETTAVTRFIFPCGDQEEATQVRWFFNVLFVDTVKELVRGEDEIWMVETGMQNQIHRWSLKDNEVTEME